ncbi:MAG: DUF1616 domain-containing protein [bacterium]
MDQQPTNYWKQVISVVIALSVIALISLIWLPISQAFRLSFGFFMVLFLPGYVWLGALYPKKTFIAIERYALSVVLSMALVPLLLFLLNKVGVPLTTSTSIISTLGLIVIGGLIWIVKRKSVSPIVNNK